MGQNRIFENSITFSKEYVSRSVILKFHKPQGVSLRVEESFNTKLG